MDHPILRAHASRDPNSAEAQSQLRRPGESELDYYERRYQERVRYVLLSDCFSIRFSFLFSNVFHVVFVKHRIHMITMQH